MKYHEIKLVIRTNAIDVVEIERKIDKILENDGLEIEIIERDTQELSENYKEMDKIKRIEDWAKEELINSHDNDELLYYLDEEDFDELMDLYLKIDAFAPNTKKVIESYKNAFEKNN